MTASYFLSIDVGTSRTAAATARISPDGTVTATAFPLGRQTDSAPTLVFVGEGELLFGDAAARRGLAQPERLAREFKRRVGDEIPLLIGDRPFLPEQLYARTVAWVIATVTEREGGEPSGVSITVPVTWTDFRTELVHAALAAEGWRDVDIITEPEAAAFHYETERPLEGGGILAVYDLGGGTFDAVVLRKDADGEIGVLGEPVGIAAFGGSDFDDIVLRHALSAAGLSAQKLATDPGERVALAALRRECVDAKESLSFDSEAVVPVLVGGGSATVRLTRAELETMIEAGIDRTVEVLADAFDSAGVDLDDVEAILLTGGSSRIPRVAQLLSERFDRPIAIDADPKAIISLGAVRAAAERSLVSSGFFDDPSDDPSEDGRQDEREDEDEPQAITARPGRRFGRRGRTWFGLGPATALAGGALMLAAGIVVSVGYPLMGTGSSATDPQPTVSSISPTPAPTSTPVPDPTPRETDTTLLRPAPPSDRISNVEPAGQ